MIVIGLTGGIGTGKSEVTRILQVLGAVVINADQVGHEAYTPHSETWQEVVEAFGEDILQDNGEIDRRKLGTVVFADPGQLARLNAIMHPRMAKIVSGQLEALRTEGKQVAVVEAAVLFEAGWESLVDEVWTIEAEVSVVVERLNARSGLNPEEVRRRIALQMPPDERAARSNVIITNSEDLESLESRVKELWKCRVKRRIERT